MATFMREVHSAETIRRVLTQERRPEVVPKPGAALVAAHRADHFILQITEGSGRFGSNGSESGMHFIFSDSPFTVHYVAGHNGSSRVRSMSDVHAVVIPGNVPYEVERSGTIYRGKISQVAAMGSHISEPVAFTKHNILKYLQGGANKLVVPENRRGEEYATGGEVVHLQDTKYVVMAPHNQEFSVGNSRSDQDFHVHMDLVESFTTFSGMRLSYAVNGTIESVQISPGDTVVVPRGVAHYTEMFGEEPTFVMLTSSRPPIKDDKFVILDDVAPGSIGDQDVLSLARV